MFMHRDLAKAEALSQEAWGEPTCRSREPAEMKASAKAEVNRHHSCDPAGGWLEGLLS